MSHLAEDIFNLGKRLKIIAVVVDANLACINMATAALDGIKKQKVDHLEKCCMY